MNLPEEIKKILNGKDIEEISIHVTYKNYKGEVAKRKIIPLSIYHGSTEYHPENQWLLKVWDIEKEDYRTYALKDIKLWDKI